VHIHIILQTKDIMLLLTSCSITDITQFLIVPPIKSNFMSNAREEIYLLPSQW